HGHELPDRARQQRHRNRRATGERGEPGEPAQRGTETRHPENVTQGAPLEPRPRPAVELAGKPVPGAPTRSSEFALVVVGCPLRRAPQRTPKPWPEFAQ